MVDIYATTTEIARAIRTREIAARDLVKHYFKRIDVVNPKINAVVTLDAERALERATIVMVAGAP